MSTEIRVACFARLPDCCLEKDKTEVPSALLSHTISLTPQPHTNESRSPISTALDANSSASSRSSDAVREPVDAHSPSTITATEQIAFPTTTSSQTSDSRSHPIHKLATDLAKPISSSESSPGGQTLNSSNSQQSSFNSNLSAWAFSGEPSGSGPGSGPRSGARGKLLGSDSNESRPGGSNSSYRHSRVLSTGMLLGGKGKEREKEKERSKGRDHRVRDRLDSNASLASLAGGSSHGGLGGGNHAFRLPFTSSTSHPTKLSTSVSASGGASGGSSPFGQSSTPTSHHHLHTTSRPRSPLSSASPLSPSSPAGSPHSKRFSQIVHQSGLLLKHEPPTAFGRSARHERDNLGRHWKAYKVELKGSKLYFYKTPGDRRADIEASFPTTILPVSVS